MSSLVQPITQMLAVLFAAAGVGGFFYPDLFIGFDTDQMQNIAHIIIGVIGFWAASSGRPRMFLLLVGVFCAVAGVLHFANNGDVLGFFSTNVTEAGAYIAIAIIGILLGTSRRN